MLERVAQTVCGCPVHVGVLGQDGWGPGQSELGPDLLVANPV